MLSFTMQELHWAFDQCARVHGQQGAIDKLARATGFRTVASIGTHAHAFAAMTALMGGRCLLEGYVELRARRHRPRSSVTYRMGL